MGQDTRTIGSTIASGKRERWVGSGNFAFSGRAKRFLHRQNTTAGFTCEERGIIPNTLNHYDLRSGFLYYALTTPACSMQVVPNSTTLGTQPNCSVGRAPLPLTKVLSTIQSPVTTSLALLWTYSFDTRTCTGPFSQKQIISEEPEKRYQQTW